MTTIHRTPGLSVWNKIFAAVLLIFGLAMAVGGGYLAAVGGSWYYLLAGAGSIIEAQRGVLVRAGLYRHAAVDDI